MDIVCFLLLLLLLGAASSSAVPDILQTEEFLLMLFSFCSMDVKIRQVSKLLAFDDACKYSALSYDQRFKYLIDEGQQRQQAAGPTWRRIPFQVPFSILLQEFIGDTFKCFEIELNLEFPDLQLLPRRQQDYFQILAQEHERLIFFLNYYNEVTFFDPSVPDSDRFSPQKLFLFYKLIGSLFPTRDFANEIIPEIQFPIGELLRHAARGSFPGDLNHQILSKFPDLIPHNLIFETLNSLNLHLTFFLLHTDKAIDFARARDHANRRPLHYAAHYGNIPLMELILNLAGNKQLNLLDQKNQKPIHKAAAGGCLEAFRWLYAKGSIVNKAGYCKSPILLAVEHEHYNIVELILSETNYDSSGDANFNMKLIQIAVSRNNLKMSRLLKNSNKLKY